MSKLHIFYSTNYVIAALWAALGKLGYKSYHFMEIGSPEAIKNKHLLCWKEALDAKILGKGKPYGKEEFDKVLGNYSVRDHNIHLSGSRTFSTTFALG